MHNYNLPIIFVRFLPSALSFYFALLQLGFTFEAVNFWTCFFLQIHSISTHFAQHSIFSEPTKNCSDFDGCGSVIDLDENRPFRTSFTVMSIRSKQLTNRNHWIVDSPNLSQWISLLKTGSVQLHPWHWQWKNVWNSLAYMLMVVGLWSF